MHRHRHRHINPVTDTHVPAVDEDAVCDCDPPVLRRSGLWLRGEVPRW